MGKMRETAEFIRYAVDPRKAKAAVLATELVDLEIEGHGKTERIRWPEAMELLDRAYTEEIAGTAALIDIYIKTALAGIVQTANALDGLKELRRRLEERHLIQKPEGGEHGND
ncbi:MAG: hypothetical protein ACI3VD_07825 [Candidatus Limivicinus sp.]